MIRYIIIEDERFAYDELKRMISKLRSNYMVCGWAQSVEQAVALVARGDYDLIISDIRLSDGLCFDVFDRQPTDAPIIFTTAYDEYALKAFELNSIDYLLKPVEEADLDDALSKLEKNLTVRANSSAYAELRQSYLSHTKKQRFLIRIGDTFRYVPTTDISCFYSEDKTTYLYTNEGRKYIVDHSLDQIESVLPPENFYRLSRACIVEIKSIERVERYFGGRLSVSLKHDGMAKIIVSRSRATDFLKWMDDEN